MKLLFEINLGPAEKYMLFQIKTNNTDLARGGHFSTVPNPPTHTYIHEHAHKRMQYN